MSYNKIRVAITHGDTNSINYELLFKAFSEPAMTELFTPIIYGSPKIVSYYRNVLNTPTNFVTINKAEDAYEGKVNLLTAVDEEIKIEMGKSTADSSKAAWKALSRAMNDYKKGLFDVLVTLPLNTDIKPNDKFQYDSQMAFISSQLQEKSQPMTMLVNEQLRIALATTQLPIKDVPAAITKELIVNKATTLWQSLKRDFMLTNPRIAVLALNPDSNQGQEETDCIIPAIQEMNETGRQVFGPYPAETFFGKELFSAFDGILAMYNDQGWAPFKTIDTGEGVRYIAGLPIVCAAPLHGVEYDEAGKDLADPLSLRHAIYLAVDIFRHRQDYDEATCNPLPKLYHEKKDDSEKVRFTIPKSKHEQKNEE